MIPGRIDRVPAGDRRWPELLARVRHDVYHSSEYHLAPRIGSGGEPYLFAYQEGDQVFLWPYLLTPIDPSPLHRTEAFDVTSVYGYAGPVASGDAAFLERGWRALLEHWREQRVVSAFTRFHPLLGNSRLCESLAGSSGLRCEGGLRLSGSTVSIDLTLPSAVQVRQYQKVLRQEIRKSHELGFVTQEDDQWLHSADFVHLYRETMTRRKGRSEYLINAAWLTCFREALACHVRLFVTKFEGVVAAALLALEYGPFLHAHLTGINAELVAHSPLKVLLDDVREWGTARGLQAFHLGGGLGGREDSLFQFKHRFSPLVHEFQIGCWILDPSHYRDLESIHRREFAERGIDIGDPGFFPIYRYQPPVPSTK